MTVSHPRYGFVREIGKGGLGVVHEVHDQLLDCRVAMKLCGASASTDRFLAEARMTKKIRHRNVISVFDLGVLEDSVGGSKVPFYIMELLVGRTLHDEIKARGPLPITEIVDWLRQLFGALDACHRAGLVHRDIKSENIFLSEDSTPRRLVVIDFGIARHGAGSGTAAAAIFGTPETMAPEQWASTTAVDQRADVYSSGIVAFELATERLPFTGNVAELMHAHREEPPPKVRVLRPELTAAFERLVDRMLAKDPAARPQSAAEVLELLEDPALIGVPRTPSPRRWRRGTIFAAAAMVTVAVAVAIALFTAGDAPAAAGALPAWIDPLAERGPSIDAGVSPEPAAAIDPPIDAILVPPTGASRAALDGAQRRPHHRNGGRPRPDGDIEGSHIDRSR